MKLNEILGTEFPLIQGGMANIATGEFAAAVEAAASTGGQIMPPIMGAAAFVMAETLGVEYPVIIKAAVLPALIYYLGIILQVQMRATKDHLHGIPRDQLPRIGQVMRERGHLLIPIIFLLYMLIWSGKTVIVAAFWTIIVTIVVAQLRPISRMSLKDICDAFVTGAKSTVSVAIACACVGIIVGVCSQTDFALNIASAIISIGRNHEQKHSISLDMTQETQSKAFAFARTLDNTGNIGHYKRAVVAIGNDAKLGFHCCKRIVGDFGFCSTYSREQSRFTCIWETYKTDIGKHLEFENHTTLYCRLAGLSIARSTVCSAFEMPVTKSAATTFEELHFLTVVGYLAEVFTGFGIKNDSTAGHFNNNIFAILAKASAAGTRLTVTGEI